MVVRFHFLTKKIVRYGRPWIQIISVLSRKAYTNTYTIYMYSSTIMIIIMFICLAPLTNKVANAYRHHEKKPIQLHTVYKYINGWAEINFRLFVQFVIFLFNDVPEKILSMFKKQINKTFLSMRRTTLKLLHTPSSADI
jgi:hypothetical protein